MLRTFACLALVAAASSCARQEAHETTDPLAGVRFLDSSLVASTATRSGDAPHVPGATADTEAEARGAKIYVEEGCVACHAPPGSARPAFAPDHAAVGLLGAERLREVIRHPEALHPGTIMPAYALDERAEGDLLAFLLARKGAPPAPPPPFADRPCASCHAAAAPAGFEHRCAYVEARKEELSCARCHQRIPAGGRCDFVESHRALCTVCHETARPAEAR